MKNTESMNAQIFFLMYNHWTVSYLEKLIPSVCAPEASGFYITLLEVAFWTMTALMLLNHEV